jgi:hypothetical protein
MKTRATTTSIALVLAVFAACSDPDGEARYAAFQMRFANIAPGMSKTALVEKVGNPNAIKAVIAEGPCSDLPAATHALLYELREPNGRRKEGYRVSMAFVVCLDAEQNVVGRSLVQF